MLFVLVHVLVSFQKLLSVCDKASQIGSALGKPFWHHQTLAVDPVMKLVKKFLVCWQQITSGHDRLTRPICESEYHSFGVNSHVAHLIIQNIVWHWDKTGMLCSIFYDLNRIGAHDFYERGTDVSILPCGLVCPFLSWTIANVLEHLLGVTVAVADLV